MVPQAEDDPILFPTPLTDWFLPGERWARFHCPGGVQGFAAASAAASALGSPAGRWLASSSGECCSGKKLPSRPVLDLTFPGCRALRGWDGARGVPQCPQGAVRLCWQRCWGSQRALPTVLGHPSSPRTQTGLDSGCPEEDIPLPGWKWGAGDSFPPAAQPGQGRVPSNACWSECSCRQQTGSGSGSCGSNPGCRPEPSPFFALAEPRPDGGGGWGEGGWQGQAGQGDRTLAGSAVVLACSGTGKGCALGKRWQRGLLPHSKEENILAAREHGAGSLRVAASCGRHQDQGDGKPRELQPEYNEFPTPSYKPMKQLSESSRPPGYRASAVSILSQLIPGHPMKELFCTKGEGQINRSPGRQGRREVMPKTRNRRSPTDEPPRTGRHISGEAKPEACS